MLPSPSSFTIDLEHLRSIHGWNDHWPDFTTGLPRFFSYANKIKSKKNWPHRVKDVAVAYTALTTQLVRTRKLPHDDYWLACGGSGSGGLPLMDWAQLLMRDTLVTVLNLVYSANNVTLSITCELASGGGHGQPTCGLDCYFCRMKFPIWQLQWWIKAGWNPQWPRTGPVSTTLWLFYTLSFWPKLIGGTNILCSFVFSTECSKKSMGESISCRSFCSKVANLQVLQKSSYLNWTSFS